MPRRPRNNKGVSINVVVLGPLTCPCRPGSRRNPLHIVQRGINPAALLFAEGTHHCYLHWLLKQSARDWTGPSIHAVLMTNQGKPPGDPGLSLLPCASCNPSVVATSSWACPWATTGSRKRSVRRQAFGATPVSAAGQREVADCPARLRGQEDFGFEALEMMNFEWRKPMKLPLFPSFFPFPTEQLKFPSAECRFSCRPSNLTPAILAMRMLGVVCIEGLG